MPNFWNIIKGGLEKGKRPTAYSVRFQRPVDALRYSDLISSTDAKYLLISSLERLGFDRIKIDVGALDRHYALYSFATVCKQVTQIPSAPVQKFNGWLPKGQWADAYDCDNHSAWNLSVLQYLLPMAPVVELSGRWVNPTPKKLNHRFVCVVCKGGDLKFVGTTRAVSGYDYIRDIRI